MLGMETVNAILDRAWKRVLWRSWTNIFLQAACLVVVVLVSYFRMNPKEQSPVLINAVNLILGVSIFNRVVLELADLRRSCLDYTQEWGARLLVVGIFSYGTTPSNLMDIAVIALRVVGTIRILGASDSTMSKGIVAAFCAQQWLMFLYSLRVLSSVGKRLLPILWAAQKTWIFALLVGLCLMAGANAYYVIGARPLSDSEPWPPYAAFLAIYRHCVLWLLS